MVRTTVSIASRLLNRPQVSCTYACSAPEFSLLTSKRMLSVNLVIIVESIRSIATHKGDDTNEFFIPAVASVASALGLPSTHFPFIDQGLTHGL